MTLEERQYMDKILEEKRVLMARLNEMKSQLANKTTEHEASQSALRDANRQMLDRFQVVFGPDVTIEMLEEGLEARAQLAIVTEHLNRDFEDMGVAMFQDALKAALKEQA